MGGQRVLTRHDHHVLPFVAGQGDEFGVLRQRLGRKAEVGGFVEQHAGDLVGAALVQADAELRQLLAQLRDGCRQHVAGLRVRRGDREGAAVLV